MKGGEPVMEWFIISIYNVSKMHLIIFFYTEVCLLSSLKMIYIPRYLSLQRIGNQV